MIITQSHRAEHTHAAMIATLPSGNEGSLRPGPDGDNWALIQTPMSVPSIGAGRFLMLAQVEQPSRICSEGLAA